MAHNNSSSKSVLPQVMLVFGIMMFLVYVGVGVAIISFGHVILPQMPATYRLLLGSLAIVYALFRLYRILNLYKNRDNIE